LGSSFGITSECFGVKELHFGAEVMPSPEVMVWICSRVRNHIFELNRFLHLKYMPLNFFNPAICTFTPFNFALIIFCFQAGRCCPTFKSNLKNKVSNKLKENAMKTNILITEDYSFSGTDKGIGPD
jgi:hypothetical protein